MKYFFVPTITLCQYCESTQKTQFNNPQFKSRLPLIYNPLTRQKNPTAQKSMNRHTAH